MATLKARISHPNYTWDVGALVANAMTRRDTKIDSGHLQDLYIRSLRASYEFFGKATAQGPLFFGYCSSRLTDAEIVEALAADPQSHDDPSSAEQSRRRVFPVFVLTRRDTASDQKPYWMWDDFRWVRDFPKWKILEEEKLQQFVWNADQSAAVSTGISIHTHEQWFGRWDRD